MRESWAQRSLRGPALATCRRRTSVTPISPLPRARSSSTGNGLRSETASPASTNLNSPSRLRRMLSSSSSMPREPTLSEGTNTMDATRYLPFLGRLLIGLPFAMSGFGKLAAYGQTTAMIAAVGLPLPPLAYAVAVLVELGGGLLLIAGYQVRLVAVALAVFSIAAAASFHNNFADQNQMIHFLKDVMLAGGLLQIAAFGAGAISLDNRLSKGRGTVASASPAR